MVCWKRLCELKAVSAATGMQEQIRRTSPQSADDSSSNATQCSHAATRTAAPRHSNSALAEVIAFPA